MGPHIFVHELIEDERTRLKAGLRLGSDFVLRRSQNVLTNSRGERTPAKAQALGSGDETIRNVILAFIEQRFTSSSDQELTGFELLI